jgi:hypothetical protein
MQQVTKNTTYTKDNFVMGIYCGQHFTGSIVDSRSTPDGRNGIFQIVLHHPVSVYGKERNKIEHWTNSSDVVYIKTK